MSEEDYIIVKDLANILSAKTILREVLPQISQVVDSEEYKTVIQILSKWEIESYKIINAND